MKKLLPLLPVLLLLQSCITDDYNFSDIDVEIAFSPDGFVIAGENSADVPLSQVIDLEEDGELIVDSLTGDYLFYQKKDDMDTTWVQIGQGSICSAKVTYHEFSMKDEEHITYEPSKRFPGYGNLTFETTIDPQFEMDAMPDAMVDICEVLTDMTLDITADFSDLAGAQYIESLTFELPSFFYVTDPSDLTLKNVKINEPFSHTIHLSGVNFKHSPLKEGEVLHFDNQTHFLDVQGVVKVKGTIKNIKYAELQAREDPILYFNFMQGEMNTECVTGRFDKREEIEIEPVSFDNLPEFIRDEEVVIDVENPILRLILENQVPATVSLNAALQGIRDGQVISTLNIGDDYGTHAISFEGPSGTDTIHTTELWISRIPTEIPEGVKENIVIPGIMDIVRTMPDEITLKATAKTDSSETITMSLIKDYMAIPRYELIVPLKMGPNMKIVYKKELDDLQSSLKYVDATSISLTATATNNLPLDLYTSCQAYDVQGKLIEDLRYTLPTSTDVIPGLGTKDLNIGIENTSTTDNALQRIDRIVLKAYATSSESLKGQTLNKNQNLRLDHITLTLTTKE